MKRWGFRSRLTLWHAASAALILGVAAVVIDWSLSRMILRQVDSTLLAVAETEAASAFDNTAGIHAHDDLVSIDDPAGGVVRLANLVQFADMDGNVLLRGKALGDTTLPISPEMLERTRNGETVIETVNLFEGEPVRLVSFAVEHHGQISFLVQVGTSLQPMNLFLHTARLLLIASAGMILLAVLVVGGVLARSALRPIDRIVDMAQQIGVERRGGRLPHPGTDDEIGRLVTTLNDMLERLEQSIEANRRFTADAAHEIRTPLSCIRTDLEIALRRSRTAEQYEAVIRSSLEEAERLSNLTAALLTLARLDAGPGRVDTVAVPNGDTTEAMDLGRRRLQEQADRRNISLVVAPDPRLTVAIPQALLTLLVDNLVENAIKFSPPGGRVSVAAAAVDGNVEFAVSDSGPGIPPALVPRIFERFYHGNVSRTAEHSGFGLGLSICRAIVDAYDGGITVGPNAGGGSTFTVRLPRAR